MSNPYEQATACYAAINANATTEFNEQLRADALIQATLAAAYEQRTSNLIALVAISCAEGWANSTDGQSIRIEALDRLGIDHKIGA